ncbi:MAG: transglycosylase domain-containing protein [Muribaculaceae bacterium]|jgi:penicillin-binding protein 1A|nr:transglycosylase domain-containing protein [Muribaculaceae bacterium]MCX4280687.1 transglycosylase domain-containing protein [Muribaculaceae bacterium]ROT21945.1 penicillin-binding protein [Muribaculaceae bacterium Isolate-114 (HZI)]ROT23872.1 penicillin-binding protein [Muribaculaceae bacterium Isolate-113 (HZI)]RXE69525.1 penicillin-binding protein [Muribaculaceae bacterium Isolate-001 (NCI)]
MNTNESNNNIESAGIDVKAAKRIRRNRSIVKWLWAAFLGLGAFIFLFLLLVYNGVIGYMPPIEELEDPHDKLASLVFASDGTTEMGRYYFGAGNRVYTDYDSVSPHVINALIATEDVRFKDHSGIDFKALGRTMVKTVMMGDKSAGGASTITQQLAKQLYSQPTGNILKRAIQKPIEWMIAVKLERFYTKDEIINMYLNRFDFLNNAVGIKTAANVYFGKEPGELKAEEAALLVGMLKNPSYYNPLRHEERARNRRNTVLDQMVKAEFITVQEGDSLKALPLRLDYHKVDHKEGGAPYLREEIRRLMTAKKPERPKRSDYKSLMAYRIAWGNYNTDSTQWEENPLYGWILKNPKPDGSYYNLYTDGLRIYTTIDTRMQAYAEDAIYQHLGGYLQPAFESEKRGQRTGPYTTNSSELSYDGVMKLIKNAIKQTERYRIMKKAGHSEEEIEKIFHTPYEMDVFAYVKENKTENGRTVSKIVPGTKTVNMSPYDSLLYMKTVLRTGLMSMDPVNGHVKAYVGGPDFSHFQYDMVSRGKRQIGSTAKPFLYTLAMEQDFTPCSMFSNTQPVFGNWAPRNSSHARIGEMVDLRWALTNSNNWISARLVNELTPVSLANKMRMFGITGYIDPTLPLCLGTVDVPVGHMVAAYTAFANGGIRVDPVFVTRIEDNQGNLIYTAVPHRTEVTSEEAHYKILSILLNVVDSGTGASLRSRYNIHAQMGGKTGTTNSNSDTWFMGFTPDLVTGVWVGGEERYIHFNTMAFGQGARAALPIYGLYMQKVYSDSRLPYSQDTKFKFPDNYNPCEGEIATYTGNEAVEEETVEGIFE